MIRVRRTFAGRGFGRAGRLLPVFTAPRGALSASPAGGYGLAYGLNYGAT